MKKYFLLVTALVTSMASQAQQTEKHDWYVGANIGAQVFNGMNDKQMSYGDRISFTGEITGGRWMKNWLALDGTLAISQFRGIYTTPRGDKHFSTEDIYTHGNLQTLRYQRGCYMQGRVDAKFDVNTVVYGYAPERKHYFLPYVGFDLASGLGSGNSRLVAGFDLGLQYRYAFKPNMAIVADFNSSWLGQGLDNEDCPDHSLHNAYGLKVGFIYTFTR